MELTTEWDDMSRTDDLTPPPYPEACYTPSQQSKCSCYGLPTTTRVLRPSSLPRYTKEGEVWMFGDDFKVWTEMRSPEKRSSLLPL